jgi:hypothetical protein
MLKAQRDKERAERMEKNRNAGRYNPLSRS